MKPREPKLEQGLYRAIGEVQDIGVEPDHFAAIGPTLRPES